MDTHIKNAFIKALSHFETPIDNVPEGYRSFLEYYFDRRHLADKFLRKSQGCHPRVKNGDSRNERNKNGDKENDATAGGNCPMEVLQHPSGRPWHFKFRPQQSIQNLDPENMDSEMLKPLNPQRPNPSQLGSMLHQRLQAAQGARSHQARNKRHSSRHQQQQGAQAEGQTGHPGLTPKVPHEGNALPRIAQPQFQRVPQNMGTAGLQMGAAPSSFVPPMITPTPFVVAPPFRPLKSPGSNCQTAPHPDVPARLLGLHQQQPAQQLSEDMGHQRYGQGRPNPPQLGLVLQQRQRAGQGARSRQARNQWHSSHHQQQQSAQAEGQTGHPGLAPKVPHEGTAPPGITQTQFQRVPQNMGTAGLQMGAAPSSFVPPMVTPPRFVVAPPFRPPGSPGANSQTAPHPDVQTCMLGLHLQQPAQQLSEDMGHQRYGQRPQPMGPLSWHHFSSFLGPRGPHNLPPHFVAMPPPPNQQQPFLCGPPTMPPFVTMPSQPVFPRALCSDHPSQLWDPSPHGSHEVKSVPPQD
ncbi:uncharacterized protein [Dermacentor andersoni]|nr:zinc finger SWIM domain-containing protein 8 homolog isoform X2 [Dermacentor andersoni]XP_054931357.1 zinc finger SWIM domain-containing protein 8 homolog isoform X2 [Dermacentor andersoni]